MKLRNKKTGEIFTVDNITNDKGEKVFCLDIVPDGYELVGVPLIKDEKIRKAVRAWAEINSIESVIYAERHDRSLCNLLDIGEDDYSIDFVGWIPTLKDGEEYTIAELCGEEGE